MNEKASENRDEIVMNSLFSLYNIMHIYLNTPPDCHMEVESFELLNLDLMHTTGGSFCNGSSDYSDKDIPCCWWMRLLCKINRRMRI